LHCHCPVSARAQRAGPPCDCAAACAVQVIEHLRTEAEADEAGRLILCCLAPRVAVVSTPNAECNCLMARPLRFQPL